MKKTNIFIFLSFFLSTACQSSPSSLDISIRPTPPEPGDTVRMEVRGVSAARLVGRFEGKEVHFYPLAKTSARLLIGLHSEWNPGPVNIEITEKKWIFPDRKHVMAVEIKKKQFRHENLWLTEGKTKLPQDPKQEEAKRTIEKTFLIESPDQLWAGKFEWPLKGKVTTSYGVRRTVNKKIKWPYHKGIDIYAPEGTDVMAPNGGVVLLAQRFPVQGRMIMLDHGQGVITTYLHLSSFSVTEKQKVEKGQIIGKVGADGFTTGPHLHWGFYIHSDPVNPQNWMQTEF
jgi:murein DD-endopeptidase MepM/ murein hydrolase activator NlpD